jgi:hypothetical protein
VAAASQSAAAWSANVTDIALGNAAEDAVYDAMVANSDAMSLARDYHADQVYSGLDDNDGALLAIAVLAIAAVLGASDAAVASLVDSFGKS